MTKKSTKLQSATEAVLSGKTRILDYFKANPHITSGVAEIVACLKFSADTFNIYSKLIKNDSVDRTSNIINGPLYVSEKYPQPVRRDGKPMFPVLQFDLNWINSSCNHSFEPVLLQMWWDGSLCAGYMRKIPMYDVSVLDLISIGVNDDVWADGALWIPDEWQCPPDFSHQILESKLIGQSCPSIDSGKETLATDPNSDEIPDELWDDLEQFSMYGNMFGTNSITEPKSKNKHIGRLFGAFHCAQSSIEDILFDGCLMHMNWAVGNGNIFFRRESDKETDFLFYFDK